MTSPNDPVNHPAHYTSHPSGVECITITRWMSFTLGNAMKYIWRADSIRPTTEAERQKRIQDLRKAVWYLNDEIEQEEHMPAIPNNRILHDNTQ